MPTTIYDSSLLTQRRSNKTIANSFITRISPPNNTTGSAPYLGISQQSIINNVKQGQMMEIRRCDGTTLIDIGCPCPELNAAATAGILVMPGGINWRQWAIGSIILKWDAPTVGTGPFSYIVTPFLNGVALPAVTTSNTEYHFETLDELKSYTFTVCATNGAGMGPTVPTTESIMMPPNDLSNMMKGIIGGDPNKCINYIINDAINKMLSYATISGQGPTKGSRLMYLWSMSLVSAWNWIRSSESVISGVHDSWNWSSKMSGAQLSDSDSVYWICTVIDFITPIFNPKYVSIYNCPSDKIAAVKLLGQWDIWASAWQTWYNGRLADGSVVASAPTGLPTTSDNWNETLIVDSVTINDINSFPDPQGWTRLTVQGKKQGYLTWDWGTVSSTCLTSHDDNDIKRLVAPKFGTARDTEIDTVKSIAANLTDEQKSIAEFWAGGPKTPSPPCMYIWLWKEFMRNAPSLTTSKIMYSLLDLSIHMFEGGRTSWMLKKEFMEARPIQEIRRRYTGVDIQSWNGVIKGDQWIPYQEANFVTPPFADFPSGHSHFGKAFSLTMSKWFGASIPVLNITYDKLYTLSPMFGDSQTGQYGSFAIAQGKSGVEPGVAPHTPLTLSWTTWEQMSESSGESRFYGGIHAATAHTASKATAVAVDGIINTSWSINTSI